MTQIEARLHTLQEARANCALEGVSMGDDAFAALLQRARAQVSNEEFVRREVALWKMMWGRRG